MNTVIVSAARTPIGSFQGAFGTLPAPRLGAIAIAEAIRRAEVKPAEVQEVIMGCVIAAGIGQAPARQAALFGGLPQAVPCLTVNKVCGSGLKAVLLADQAIKTGASEIVVAGGMENMTLAPYLLPKGRTGFRLGHGEVIDSMIRDGLWDVYNNFHMGSAAELCAKEYRIGREEQDRYAVQSYERAIRATKEGKFKSEIVPVEIEEGKKIFVETDEEPFKASLEKLKRLRPAFACPEGGRGEKEGTVTAGNASSINDGAAALLLMSSETAKARGLRPLARIVGYAQTALAPEWFTIAPAEAIKKNLSAVQMKLSDIDLFEINEAFSVVSLVNNKLLNLSEERVNVHGGAVALGHPIGASGARILTTLLYALQDRNLKRGLASLCIGGGEGISMVVERL